MDCSDVAGLVGRMGIGQILYLTRNGLLEPLGQSQIWPYLRGLSSHYRITLITFEKPDAYRNPLDIKSMHQQCNIRGIHWIPLRFHQYPRPWAPAFSIIQLAALALLQWCRSCPPQLVHVRSYVPAAIALLLNRLTGVSFIFDMRALWPEELITAGHLQRGSLLHRLIITLERSCLKDSSAVVLLTRAAEVYLRDRYPRELASQRLAVIPTCADLKRFQLVEPIPSKPIIIGCIGTLLSGWFLIDWLRAFFEAYAQADLTARFEIISMDPRDSIINALRPSASLANRLQIRSATPVEMPVILQKHSASVMFYSGGSTSELGRSPTRMAEVLGTGRPVVANPGVGDVEQVIITHRVGVLARSSDATEMNSCVAELMVLLEDPNLGNRCRRTAEQLFSLESGISAYYKLYSEILS